MTEMPAVTLGERKGKHVRLTVALVLFLAIAIGSFFSWRWYSRPVEWYASESLPVSYTSMFGVNRIELTDDARAKGLIWVVVTYWVPAEIAKHKNVDSLLAANQIKLHWRDGSSGTPLHVTFSSNESPIEVTVLFMGPREDAAAGAFKLQHGDRPQIVLEKQWRRN